MITCKLQLSSFKILHKVVLYCCNSVPINNDFGSDIVSGDHLCLALFLLLARYVPNVAKEEYMRSV